MPAPLIVVVDRDQSTRDLYHDVLEVEGSRGMLWIL